MNRDLKQVFDNHISAAEAAGEVVMCICCGTRPASSGYATCRSSCTRKFTADFERQNKAVLEDSRFASTIKRSYNELAKRPGTKEVLRLIEEEVQSGRIEPA